MTTRVAGNKWDIECELYGKWCSKLERISVKFTDRNHAERESLILDLN